MSIYCGIHLISVLMMFSLACGLFLQTLSFRYPSKNSQAGCHIGNRMARGYWFDLKWVYPMGSYVWGIQVFCSRNEMAPHFSNRRLEYLRHNFPWDRLISRQTDNPWPTIPEISTRQTIFWGCTWKTEFVKTIHGQERTSSEGKSDGLHEKCSTILMFELLLCCHTAARCMETFLILEWFPPKEFYKLPVTMEKKSWRFPFFCKSYCQRKTGTFLWATLFM